MTPADGEIVEAGRPVKSLNLADNCFCLTGLVDCRVEVGTGVRVLSGDV